MDIVFKDNKLTKLCNDKTRLVRELGADRARRVQRRLDDLRAAANLEVMRTLPGRCHELTGNRAGQLSLDLDHPHRLIFVPANNPVPLKPDDGLDWAKVTAVKILGIEDPHE
ncbi:killer suppression protein [Phormidium sp. FACHB-592]|uniref:Killer suppression protein HigA n=1 Tax=Stenomitos frigidus AS-A4 TaxID=2933935 RepID=A0ABV0KSP2_9CYAN|nr:killer suppression protein [Phormidium sp. FACHB-592]MBD2077260.1 killer suppression protein [Phormidium sp. FACHB-592]